MYAIVEMQGQQFKVEQGRWLYVHHIKGVNTGDTVEFDKVFLIDTDGTVTVGTPTIEGAKVVCEVLDPMQKGEKVQIFKKKRRKGYRRLRGHRQQFTKLSVKELIA